MKKIKENRNIIEIKEEVKIGDTFLEKGDKIEILNEDYMYYRNEIKSILPEDQYGTKVKFQTTNGETKWMNVNEDFFDALDSLREYFIG